MVGLLGIAVAGIVLDLFSLLLLPYRIGGHLSPIGPLVALVTNAALGYGGNRLLQSRRPAQVLLALAIALSLVAAGRGPGGDLFVTRDLQGLYLLYVIGAALGASVPLFVRASPGGRSGRDTSRGDLDGAGAS
ncbi:MAG: hypothetical protein JWN77_2855 [Frankiales bacterium]|jgi:hypothetical protein|nr:hypothetical protein [Frankiales bacterium]